ncbi:MAG: glucose-6-phosphate isomerase [Clostridia bacterium]|nr:glucose-6-phosphate isomerase [Clostridia bacterium]
MAVVDFDMSMAPDLAGSDAIEGLRPEIENAHRLLTEKTGAGNDFLGWYDLPFKLGEEYGRVKAAAERIRKDSQVLVVVGIGGSYLGARAVIETLTDPFANAKALAGEGGTAVIFAGNSISPGYLSSVLDVVKDRDFSVNVISKSGTTTEPAVTFRFFKELLEKKYGREGAAKRIYATTDKARGACKKMADAEGYETFVIPDDVGGRFSVLTPVGLLPIAVAGIDTDALVNGAKEAFNEYQSCDLKTNPCYAYAAARTALYRSGKAVELLVNYEPGLHYLTEWWKQLYGESEGKDGKGLFPAGCDFTTDLHSMGQYIQDGVRLMFETAVEVRTPATDLIIGSDADDYDGLNYLSGRGMDFVNKQAAKGTAMAHVDGGVPNLKISIEKLDARGIGGLIYFFERACAVSGYMLGVNPFDQPGVEAYKKNMFRLLGKPV